MHAPVISRPALSSAATLLLVACEPHLRSVEVKIERRRAEPGPSIKVPGLEKQLCGSKGFRLSAKARRAPGAKPGRQVTLAKGWS